LDALPWSPVIDGRWSPRKKSVNAIPAGETNVSDINQLKASLVVTDKALLLSDRGGSSENGNLAKVLNFFGVPWQTLTAAEFLASYGTGPEALSKSRLICSSGAFLKLVEEFECEPDYIRTWQESVHSAFVYGSDDAGVLQKLVRKVSGDERAVICTANSDSRCWVLSDQLNDFCGVMAGLRITGSETEFNAAFVSNTSNKNTTNIISTGSGATFLKFDYQQVPVFLSTFSEIIEIDTQLTSQYFDVQDHFLSAVPLVLYVKWAFAETCWRAPETNACLVMDDPVLKPRHGFVNFRELLPLMKRHKFTTNVAFIPWNWRRSSPEVVKLFRENPENYSVSVHGSDHTRAEFGSSNQQRLYWKTRQALERMDRHESITGIHHDRVMIFPQGIFSGAALSAIKGTELIAAVNNDVISSDPHPPPITISDVWDVAVMRYSSFPIFTRRNPWEGIENFAFDALLGKPVLIVIHHDYCSDHCARLVSFIERLNDLNCSLNWTSLGEAVRRSCRQRERSRGVFEVEMYGAELRLENRSGQQRRYLIRRRECEPSAIREIRDGSAPIGWNFVDDYIHFETDLDSGQSKTVSVRFHAPDGQPYNGENISYRFKAMLRRYLCEVRDNYITTHVRPRVAELWRREQKTEKGG
jgi:hypothetical protein